MIDKTSTVLIVALISILGLTSCIRYNVAAVPKWELPTVMK